MDLKSNEPFWLIKNGLIHSYPSIQKDETCDVLIVGAGITGALIAHQCIAQGMDTIVIDTREVCNGSTSATTSMLQYEIDIPLFKLKDLIGNEEAISCYHACSQAINTLEDISKSINSRAGFKRKHSLYYADTKNHSKWLMEEYRARKEAGFDVSWLSAKDILEKYGIHGTYGGILSTQGASIDAFLLAHEILQYNTNKGLKIYDKTALLDVKTMKDQVIAKTDRNAQIKAKKIIYCTGYESAAYIPKKIVRLKSTYAIVSEISEQYHQLEDVLVWNTSLPYLYMRTTSDGRLLIGGEDEAFKNPYRRDLLLRKKGEKLSKQVKKLLPKKDFIMDFVWAGTFGETKDGLPYIGEYKKFKNGYFVLGFGGNGITFSVIGMQMVSAWLNNTPHSLSGLFSFER